MDTECLTPGEHSVWPASRKEAVRSVCSCVRLRDLILSIQFIYFISVASEICQFVVMDAFYVIICKVLNMGYIMHLE